ncbi:MAG: DNA-binding transcriptional regulator [Bacteroidales bacterium]|nr:DNA-binding transcriptional regulator [Bacteroidales bacterium]
MRKVILLIDCASEFDRKLLRGIVRYSHEKGPWQFYRMPSWYSWDENGEQHILRWARKWQADGIIGRWNSSRAPLLKKLGIPIVLQNYRSRSKDYSNLTGDYIGTGEIAADFFIKRQFTNFAYYGVRNVVWSEERLQGFSERVSEAGGSLSTMLIDVPENEARREVTAWLRTLPKSVALFCCDDAHALFISEICKTEGIQIPTDLALLGVDNDDLFCEISDPPISSIELDVEQGGYRTCQMLEERMQSGSKEPFTVVIKPRQIVRRKSTDRHDIKDAAVAKVVSFIEENFASDIGMQDILACARMSRRNLELRFKNEMDTTIYQYLISCRLDCFARLLLSTDRPLMDIAMESGFLDSNNLSRTFKKFYGMSPKEYRSLNCGI